MKLISIQEVAPYGFTLYFLAYTSEDPPEADLRSVNIREWVWKRPFTTLELQHIPGAQLEPLENQGVGVHCVEFEISPNAVKDICDALKSNSYDFEESGDDSMIRITDPDGSRLVLKHK